MEAQMADAPVRMEPAATSRTASARLLQYERGRHVALPVQATIEVIDRPQIVPIPGGTYYGAGMTKWQDRWLPVLELHVLLNAYRKEYSSATRYLLVVAYQAAPRQPLSHGVIALPLLPTTVQVADTQRCALPNDSDLWSSLAVSCFEYQGHPVPILDVARLFKGDHG